MATQTTTITVTVIELAEKIENWIINHFTRPTNFSMPTGLQVIYEDMLLVGPTEKTAREMVMAVLTDKGISCTEDELTSAALFIREKSLRASLAIRGLH